MADNFNYVLFPALIDMLLKPFSGIGTEAGIPADESNQNPITPPTTPINPPIINDGKDGVFGGDNNGRDFPYAYEDKFWGSQVPDTISNQRLWDDVKAGLKSGSPYMGVFGSMLSGGSPLGLAKNIKAKDYGMLGLNLAAMAPTSPLGILGPLFGTMFASPSTAMNPINDPTIRNGLLSVHSSVASINPTAISAYGATPKEFNDFLDGVFGSGNSFSPKATPQTDALFGMVGVTNVTEDMLMNLRTNSMNTARAISMDLQSNFNPNIIGFKDIKYLNTSPTFRAYPALAPYDVAKINDLAYSAGVHPSAISYAYHLNPAATSMRLNSGDPNKVKDALSTNNHLGYLDTTRGLTESYKAGIIGFDEWGYGVLDAKDTYNKNQKDIEEKGAYKGNDTYGGGFGNKSSPAGDASNLGFAGRSPGGQPYGGSDKSSGGNGGKSSGGRDATGTGSGTGRGTSGNLGGSAPGRDWG